MKAEDLFHLGIVTDKPEATRMELRALFGYEWGDEIGGPIAVTVPVVTEATRVGSDGQPFFTFHRSATTGLRIELVSRVAQPGLQRCWARPERLSRGPAEAN
ncbi:hypothetical protein HYG77_10515 [Rhodococcus sp. ZPP]|uniref:hypothetical protein n=1 Tax=Rhodococcus sp. ZPP TaxID=2749906 RepID=UPI001AD8597C|nr:hypothetical protein [Rhodococcus sp. ZPP]QTJ65988.1 hypothetical protein HYG77_10515 [Rhodococcus sp. ZPP]